MTDVLVGDLHKVDQEPNGCWVACVASITGIPLADLPKAEWDQYADPIVRQKNWSNYHNKVIRAIGEKGWAVAYLGASIPMGYAIATGKSPRSELYDTINHCVVVYDGKFSWDPHSSRDYVTDIYEYEILVRIEPYFHTESWESKDAA